MTIEHRFIDYRKGGKYYNGKSPGYDMDDIFHAIQSAIKDEQSKLKPQYKKAGLIVTVKHGYPNSADTNILVQVKSIVNGISTPEELYKDQYIKKAKEKKIWQ